MDDIMKIEHMEKSKDSLFTIVYQIENGAREEVKKMTRQYSGCQRRFWGHMGLERCDVFPVGYDVALPIGIEDVLLETIP